MLKIFEKVGDAEPATYLFHFNTAEAKEEAKAVKDLLSSLLASSRGGDAAVPKPSGANGGSSTLPAPSIHNKLHPRAGLTTRNSKTILNYSSRL
jgi:transcription initiation factor TFIIH subunit 1